MRRVALGLALLLGAGAGVVALAQGVTPGGGGSSTLATNSVFGIAKGDGSTLNCVAGVCSSVSGGAGTVTENGNLLTDKIVTGGTNGTTDIKTNTTGTGVVTALGVNIGSAGAPVVNGGALGTPSSGVGTNLTGTAAGLTAGTVTTNANLTGPITSTGNATAIASAAIALSKIGGEVDGDCILGAGGVWTAGSCGGGGGSGTVTNAANLTTNAVVLGDGGTVGIKTTTTGTGVVTLLGTPSSANLAAALTDETGTGAAVFAGSPALTGTPTAPTASVGTNTTQVATTAYVLANGITCPTGFTATNADCISEQTFNNTANFLEWTIPAGMSELDIRCHGVIAGSTTDTLGIQLAPAGTYTTTGYINVGFSLFSNSSSLTKIGTTNDPVMFSGLGPISGTHGTTLDATLHDLTGTVKDKVGKADISLFFSPDYYSRSYVSRDTTDAATAITKVRYIAWAAGNTGTNIISGKCAAHARAGTASG